MKKRLFFLLTLIVAIGICIAGVVLFVLPGATQLADPTVVYSYHRYLDRTMSVRNITYEDTHGFWAYYADNADLESDLLIKHDGCGIQTGNVAEGQFLAVKIRVPTSGSYKVQQKYAPMNGNGGTADVHILPAETAVDQIPTALTKKTKVGSLDFYGMDAETMTADFGTVSFPTEGEYLVVYQSTGKNGNSAGNCFYISDFTLEGNGQNVIMGLSASADKNVLNIDETTQITATAYLSTGETEVVAYQYVSNNGNAVVSEDGTVTAKVSGPVEIQVTASLSDSTVTVPVHFNALDSNFSGNSYSYALSDSLPAGTALQSVTYANTNNTWAYFDSKGVANALKLQDYGIQDLNTHFNHYVAIKIQVPTAGEYLFTQTNGRSNKGCEAGVYILPASTTKDALRSALTAENMLGKVNFFTDNTAMSVFTSNLGIATFPTAGEYIVVYKPLNEYGVSNMFIGDISLDGSGISNISLGLDDMVYVSQDLPAQLLVTMNSKRRFAITGENVNFDVSNPSALAFTDGTFTANKEGFTTVTATGTFLSQTLSASQRICVIQHPGKTEPTYYTYEMRRIAQENIATYPWAKEIRDAAARKADDILDLAQVYADLIIREGIPRSRQVGYNGDGQFGVCRYCGVDVHGKYGSSGIGGFEIDPVNHPWKVQCRDCKRYFPSNDFESFYKLGLDETGKFDYDKAWEENDKLIAAGKPGYLVNELYPEMGEYWGVDDGYGARVYKDGSEYHKYIPNDPNLDKPKSAVYVALWGYLFWEDIWDMMSVYSNAYLYTEDLKYARAGAILIDRMADVISEYNFRNFERRDYLVTCGGSGYGVFLGRIFDPQFMTVVAKAADAFFPMLDDPELIANLSAKAKELGLENDKSSGEKIWQNWRDNLFAPALQMAEEGKLKGNYGIAEQCIAVCAITVAEEPLASEMMEWIYKANNAPDSLTATGGNFNAQVLDVVDRDGFGNEAAPNYNFAWLIMLYDMADQMARYEGVNSYNPYDNPKFVQMFLNWDALTQSDYYTAQIGDTGYIASSGIRTSIDVFISVWKQLKDTPLAPKLAQYIYTFRSGNLNNTRYDIFTENPESFKDEIMAYVDTDAPKESTMLPGYGYATLKEGITGNKESLRSIWTYHGMNYAHGHHDTLNIGIDAFGLNLSPDLGYPANTINDPTNSGFIRTTVAHNTVVVNEIDQYWNDGSRNPYIFDDSELVKVMGIEAKEVYSTHSNYQATALGKNAPDFVHLTDSYNRTVVMVKVDDTNSYYVDFFRVLGGNQHTYSFHSQSHNAAPVSGLQLIKQADENGNYIGTYAGTDIEKGADGDFPVGYNYFTKVRKDTNLTGNIFSVDFAVTDYRKILGNNGEGIHLKMTQITNFIPDEVAIVGGHVTVASTNKVVLNQTDTLEYVLTQRKAKDGEKLDSLFSTVFEPYRNESYLASIEEVPVTVISGTPGATDLAKALLITHKDGRKDYVFYATNNEITYRVADLFNVRGYVGVYSVGKETFRYVAGGNLVGDELPKTAVYTGKVLNYSTDLTLYENFIDVDIDSAAAELLTGKYVYIENDGKENAVYKIEKATPIDGGVRLDIGTVSLIRSMQNKLDAEAGYIYNIEKSQKVQIPMSYLVTP